MIPQIAEELKGEVEKQMVLCDKRREVMVSLKKGKEFFTGMQSGSIDIKLASQAASRMAEIVSELEYIDKQINDINIIIIAKLESYIGDFVAKFMIPERINDAGDVIPKTIAYGVPFKMPSSDLIEVTPDDIWFLKLIKQALGTNNIELLDKSEYYHENNKQQRT